MKEVSFSVGGELNLKKQTSVFMNQENQRRYFTIVLFKKKKKKKRGWLLIFSMNEDSHPERNEAGLSTVAESERVRAPNICRGERGPI